MENKFYNSQEDINNRIIKNIEDFWKLKEINQLDPLVKLLMQALSNELFSIVQEVYNVESKLLEKISKILIPNYLKLSVPSHTIITAQTFDELTQVDQSFEFTCDFEKSYIDTSKIKTNNQIYFTPISTLNLVPNTIQYIAVGKEIAQFKYNIKEEVNNSLNGRFINDNTVYIGINNCKNLVDLSGLNLFFNWNNFAVDKSFYELLSLVKCTLGNTSIKLKRDKFISENNVEENDFYKIVKNDVKQFYNNKFLTFQNLEIAIQEDIYKIPNQLIEVFDDEYFNKLENKIIWFKLEFPERIESKYLSELSINCNAFPVINKKKYSVTHRIKAFKNIIPLHINNDEDLLFVSQLKDDFNTHYKEFSAVDNFSTGVFTVKCDDIERFDRRNAKQLIAQLLEIVRDEKSSFSVYGAEFLNETLKSLDENLTKLEYKNNLEVFPNAKGSTQYILLNSNADINLFYIDYWLTQGEKANHIANGTKFKSNDARLIKESIYIVQNSKGGRAAVKGKENVGAFKYGITTLDKIVTKNDLINFCKNEFRDLITDVEITNGYELHNDCNKSIHQTIDVKLYANKEFLLNKTEWNDLIEICLSKIYARSIINSNFRMFLYDR